MDACITYDVLFKLSVFTNHYEVGELNYSFPEHTYFLFFPPLKGGFPAMTVPERSCLVTSCLAATGWPDLSPLVLHIASSTTPVVWLADAPSPPQRRMNLVAGHLRGSRASLIRLVQSFIYSYWTVVGHRITRV